MIATTAFPRCSTFRETAAARLSAQHRVSDSGCWLWTGSRNGKGYGLLSIDGRSYLAHRLSMLVFNQIDPGEFLVCHSCDEPRCVRPDHLFVGTASDNTADMTRKGRARRGSLRGESASTAKVTEAIVIDIMERTRRGATRAELGRRFGLSVSAVSRIVLGQNWKHITASQAAPRSTRGRWNKQ